MYSLRFIVKDRTKGVDEKIVEFHFLIMFVISEFIIKNKYKEQYMEVGTQSQEGSPRINYP